MPVDDGSIRGWFTRRAPGSRRKKERYIRCVRKFLRQARRQAGEVVAGIENTRVQQPAPLGSGDGSGVVWYPPAGVRGTGHVPLLPDLHSHSSPYHHSILLLNTPVRVGPHHLWYAGAILPGIGIPPEHASSLKDRDKQPGIREVMQ